MKNLFLLSVFCAGALWSQTTVILNGVSYTTSPHPRTLLDGPGGAIDSGIKDPDGPGPSKARKAVATNPAWVALTNSVNVELPAYQAEANRYGQRYGTSALDFAIYWYADNSQTAAHDAALYMLNHIEYYVPFICVESMFSCTNDHTGYGITSYGLSYWLPDWILAYELMRGEMTDQQRHTFAAKIVNDRADVGGIDGSPSTSCSSGTVNSGLNVSIVYPTWSASDGSLVSIVFKQATGTVTINGSTAGMSVGDQVRLQTANGYIFLNVQRVLNNNQFNVGYYFVPDGSYSPPGLSITYNKALISSPAPVFGTTMHTGDWFFTATTAENVGTLGEIIDASHAYLNGGVPAISGKDLMYYRPKDWSPGDCGYLWYVKHNDWTPSSLSSPATYPTNGGENGGDPGHNLTYSGFWGIQLALVSVIDDDVNASVRSAKELSIAYNAWYNGPYSFAKRFITGFHQSGSGYGLTRMHEFLPGTAIALQNSFLNPPALMSGVWARNILAMDYANVFPNAQAAQMPWGQPDVAGAPMTPANTTGTVLLAYWFRNSPEGSFANWFLQNLWTGPVGYGNPPLANSGWNAANIGSQGAWFFMFSDTSWPASSLAGAPTTFPWNLSDTGVLGSRADGLISRTGYLSATDTLLDFHAESVPEFDHNASPGQASNYASYKIFKGRYLLAEDGNFGGMTDPSVGGMTAGGTASNYIEVGGTVATVLTGGDGSPVHSGISRATGTNNYAYAMADVTTVYIPAAGVQHAYRHLVDFKAPGTQQFLIDYMDVATSKGAQKRAYYHYPNKSTTTLNGDTLTSTNANPNSSQLITKVLAPQPVLLASDTSGPSFRLDICPSSNGTDCDQANRQGEMLVVHMPVAGTGNSLPPMTLLTSIDLNFTGIEIDGANPKVAVFARNGGSYTGSSFTVAHSGTAQILIAGITPTATSHLEYTLTKDGVPVVEHFAAGSDGTLYLEGTAGSYRLVGEQPRPVIRNQPLADAQQYQPYNATFTVDNGATPLVWEVIDGLLPTGLTLDRSSGVVAGSAVTAQTAMFTIQVTDAIGQTNHQQFTLSVDAAPMVTIITHSFQIPSRVPVSQRLVATGGAGHYTWAVSSGSLPTGCSLSSDGLLNGQLSEPETARFTVVATDNYGNSASAQLELTVLDLPVTWSSGVTLSGLTLIQ